MKTIFSLTLPTGCLVAALTLGACASQSSHTAANSRRSGYIPTRDDRNSVEVAGGPVGGGNGAEYRVPTGSQLPSDYNRRAYSNDSQYPSYTYDQNDIRLQSTNSVGDSLRSVPGVSVGGTR